MKKESKVCVTGGSGYIAACLINKLLQKGYTVHATLRNLKDESKVEVLRRLPHGGEDEDRLVLFEADIYTCPHQFQAAIQGCHFVFHVATPMQYQQYKSMSEAAIEGVRRITTYCIKSKTVKRLIYTASVVAASPLRDDDSGFKDFMDETCWTPLHLSFQFNNDQHQNYTDSKTQSEREILSYNKDGNGNGLEVVSLACGLVGGDIYSSLESCTYKSTPLSVKMLVSPLLDLELFFHSLRFLEELLAKIPIVHIEDVCDAHIFCIQAPTSISGRFLVASSYVSSLDLANYYLQSYPQFHINQKYLEGPNKRDIKWASTKFTDIGFAYKYDMEMILDDSIKCAKRMGDL